jgi:hypothetical protein
MFGSNKEGKPVDLVAIEPTFIDGTPVLKGQVLEQVPPDLALELAAAGKVRGIGDADELKALKAAFKRSQVPAQPAAGDQAQLPA